MSETDLDAKEIESKVSDLAEAMERVRNDQAVRDDVVVEMKQARLARLEMLARDLQPLFKDVPDDNDQFEFALTRGETPRLWIDMTSHVRMGRDRREYEFVKDTRMGRTILGRSQDRETIARRVSDYVAERILERERMMEGEWQAMRDHDFDGGDKTGMPAAHPAEKDSGLWGLFGWFVIGIAIGAAAMFGWNEFGEAVRAYFGI